METQIINKTPFPFKSISKSIRYQILSYKFLAGAKLPSIRVLAQKYNCNPNTICRALNKLVSDGLIIKNLGRGYYVVDDVFLIQEKRRLELKKLTMELFASLSSLGYKHDEILELNETFPLPEYLFFLDVDPNEALRRIDGRSGGREIYETAAFLERARALYRSTLERYADSGMKIFTADTSRPSGETEAFIASCLDFLPECR